MFFFFFSFDKKLKNLKKKKVNLDKIISSKNSSFLSDTLILFYFKLSPHLVTRTPYVFLILPFHYLSIKHYKNEKLLKNIVRYPLLK
jgi:hypothetical protein